jgi:hypothetical protein
LHVLTAEIRPGRGSVVLAVHTGVAHEGKIDQEAFSGFLFGFGEMDDDYRQRAMAHGDQFDGQGLIAGVDGEGIPKFWEVNGSSMKLLPSELEQIVPQPRSANENLRLEFDITPEGEAVLKVTDALNGILLSEAFYHLPDPKSLAGNVALIAHKGAGKDNVSFWFENLHVSGSKLHSIPERVLGPVINTELTQQQDTLKIAAQLAAADSSLLFPVLLEYRKMGTEGHWDKVFVHAADSGNIAVFQVENLENNALEYRVSCPDLDEALGEPHYFEGKIPKPVLE